jgi:hypothetical protein
VSDSSISTKAELTLRVLSGQTEQFRLLVPPQAEVRPHASEDPQKTRIQTIEIPDPRGPLRVIRLKEAITEPVLVEVQFSQPRPAGTFPPPLVQVQPIALVGAARQRGAILIAKTPDLQLTYYPRTEPQVSVNQRDLTEEERQRDPSLAAAFTYWNVVLPEQVDQPALPLLDLRVDKVREVIEARVSHTLTLTHEEGSDRLVWKLKTQIDLTPFRTPGVDALQIQLPPTGQFESDLDIQPTLLVRGVDPPDPAGRVKVLLERQVRPFSLTLEGTYHPLDAGTQETTLKLPYPVGTLDRGTEIKASVPAGEFQLVSGRSDDPSWDAATAIGKLAAPGQHTWSFKRRPEQLDLAWRSYRQELPVESVIDVFLSGRQAQVEQRLTYRSSPPPDELILRVPEEISERVRIVGLGRLRDIGERDRHGAARPGFEVWRVRVDEKKDRSSWTLRYSVPLPEAGPTGGPLRLDVPLLRPERASRVESRVRVWAPSGGAVAVVGDRWEELPIKAVPEEDSLPDLVLSGTNSDAPLSLRLGEPVAGVVAPVPIERALVRAAIAEDGAQTYRSSFLLRPRPHGTTLTLDLPGPASSLNVKMALWFADDNGSYASKEVPWKVVDDAGQTLGAGRTIRIELDPGLLTRKSAVLEIEYQLPPDLARAASGLLQSTLLPPVPRGDGGRFPIRWLVWLPGYWLPLAEKGGLAAERRWGWRGWLLGPRPVETRAEVERGFYPEGVPLRDEALAAPALIVSSFALEPLRLRHVPQQAWLVLCSLSLLGVGLGLYLLALTRPVLWPVLVVLSVAILIAGLWWPGLLANILYGCEPGALVLMVVLGVQWLLQRRYRRQVVFMPGFQRLKTGSSLIRPGSSQRPRIEPSTVDAAPAGDALEKKDGSKS